MSDLEDGLELDRGELAEAALAAPAVVGAFDPVDDLQPQLLSAAPASTVEHVLLEQGEERLHGRVVRAGPGPAHRADESVRTKGPHELGRSELGTAVGVHDRARHRTAERYRVA